jgi:pseudouridine-5'-monophosphatase
MSAEAMPLSSDGIAAIFDMDGVLVDSVGLNWRAMNQVLAPYGVTISNDEVAHYLGKTLKDQVEQLNDEHDLNLKYEAFETTMGQIKAALFAELRPKDGVEELLGNLQVAQIPLAVATSMPRELTLHRLETAGLMTFFDTLVTADDVIAHKPSPEVYQKAAASLGVHVSICVVFEDAPAGIAAAKAAGMRCIAVRTPYASLDRLQDADLIVPSMQSISLQTVRSLVLDGV